MLEFLDEESYSEYLATGEFETFEVATEDLLKALVND